MRGMRGVGFIQICQRNFARVHKAASRHSCSSPHIFFTSLGKTNKNIYHCYKKKVYIFFFFYNEQLKIRNTKLKKIFSLPSVNAIQPLLSLLYILSLSLKDSWYIKESPWHYFLSCHYCHYFYRYPSCLYCAFCHYCPYQMSILFY